MPDNPQGFLCYARDDEAKVKALYSSLTEAGFDIWLDTERLLPGQQWRDEIERAIKRSEVVIVCLSSASIQKRGFLQRGIRKAVERLQEKLESDIYLIPARLDDCEVPKSLSNIQWVDLFKEGGLDQLIRTLKTALGQAQDIRKPGPISAGTHVTPKSKDDKIKILLFNANPDGMTLRLLDEEQREIKERVRAAAHRDLIEIVTVPAVRPADLLQAMNEHEPHVVQFSGHGSEDAGILVLDERGQAKAISGEALALLFQSTYKNVQVAVLNASYTQPQAEAIAEVVPCVIGMRGTMSDEGARFFAASFYSALGFGHSVKTAFEQGLVRLKLEGIETHFPTLLTRPGVSADEIVLVNPTLPTRL